MGKLGFPWLSHVSGYPVGYVISSGPTPKLLMCLPVVVCKAQRLDIHNCNHFRSLGAPCPISHHFKV